MSYNDYPIQATNNSKRALEFVRKNGWGKCGTSVGRALAYKLANRKPLTRETIAKMSSFVRHAQYKNVPYNSGCGGLMWDCWGGDSGILWAKKKLRQIDMAKRFKKGSIEAKRFMAKIRLKKGKPKSSKKTLGNINKNKYSKLLSDYDKKGAFLEDATTKKQKDKLKKELDKIEFKINKYERTTLSSLAPINKSEQTLSFVPKVITENQILKEINKVKEEISHLLNMQKEHILKGHKRSLGALVKNKQKEIGNLLKKCK